MFEKIVKNSWTITRDRGGIYRRVTLEIHCENGGFRVVLTESHWNCLVYAWPYFTPEKEWENAHFKDYADARHYAENVIKAARHYNAEVLYNDLVC